MPENILEGVLLWAQHEKAGFFGNDNNAGKMEGSRRRGRPNMRQIDSIKESTGMMSLQELSRAVRTGRGSGGRSSIELPGVCALQRHGTHTCSRKVIENWQPDN